MGLPCGCRWGCHACIWQLVASQGWLHVPAVADNTILLTTCSYAHMPAAVMVMSSSGSTAYFGSPQRVIALLSEPRQMQQQAVELTAGALEPVRGGH